MVIMPRLKATLSLRILIIPFLLYEMSSQHNHTENLI